MELSLKAKQIQTHMMKKGVIDHWIGIARSKYIDPPGQYSPSRSQTSDVAGFAGALKAEFERAIPDVDDSHWTEMANSLIERVGVR